MKKYNLIPPLGVRGLLFVFFALVALSCCKKKNDPTDPNYDPNLPNATQEGKNTFGCYVNGQVYIPKSTVFPYNSLAPDYDDNYFNLSASINTSSIVKTIGMGIKDLAKVGVYNFDNASGQGIIYSDYKTLNSDCGYYDPYIQGFYRKAKIEITKFDTQKNIVSGLFEATLKIPTCDTIKITKGRFDVKIGN